MLKKTLPIMALLHAAACLAAVEVNQATVAELDGIRGIGPGLSARILQERKSAAFKDWNDLIHRVQGVGEASARRFSAEGMTVNGQTFSTAPQAPATPAASAPKK